MNDEFPQAIAALYAGAFEFSLERFKDEALTIVREIIPFTSAVWGTGIASSGSMLTVAVLDIAPDRLVDYAQHWQDQDFVREAALAEPGRAVRIDDVMPYAEYHRLPVYRDYAAPSGIEHSLAIASQDPGLDLVELVCLFRDDPAASFSDDEVERLGMLMPHLAKAWQHRQIVHALDIGQAPSRSGYEVRGYAVTDPTGLIYTASAGFADEVRRLTPGWTGPQLPAAVADCLPPDPGSGKLADLIVHVSGSGERQLVTLLAAPVFAALTASEVRVAKLYASGATNTEIAAALGVSPSTVRNQLASTYAKLGIGSKAELARVVPAASIP